MKIAIIFDTSRPDTTGIYFKKALEELGHSVNHFQSHELSNIEKKYDIYLRIDDGENKNDIPKDLFPKVFYAIDVHLQGPEKKVRKSISKRQYDFIISPVQWWVKNMKSKFPIDLAWVNMGCDLDIHKKIDLEKIYDIGFVGNDGGVPRKFYLQELRERYSNSFIGSADYREMNAIYSKSKIGFNFAIRQESITMRSFEVMSCGTMLLMRRLRDDSLEKLGYVDRRHLVIFDGPKDLFKLIDYYLENKKEREEIAQNGYRLTIEKHKYRDRAKEMIDIISNKFNLK